MSRRDAPRPGLPPSPPPQEADGDPFEFDVVQMTQTNWGPRWEEFAFCTKDGKPLLTARRVMLREESALAFAIVVAIVFASVFGAMFVAYFLSGDERRMWHDDGMRTLLILLIGGGLAIVPSVIVLVRLLPHRHVNFVDASSKAPVLSLVEDAERRFATQRFTVALPGGHTIGALRRRLFKHIVRSEWHAYAPDGATLLWKATESSLWLALCRRFVRAVIRRDIPSLRRFNIVEVRPTGRRILGRFRQLNGGRETYELDLTADGPRAVDRRLAIAVAVLLDSREKHEHGR